MIQASATELAFLILTFTEEGLGKLLGLRMLTLRLIAAQKNCVVSVSSVNTVSFGLDRFVTLRPLRKKNGCMKAEWLKHYKLFQKDINLGWSNRQKESKPDALNRNKKINSCWTQKTGRCPQDVQSYKSVLSPPHQAERNTDSQTRQCSPKDCYQGSKNMVDKDHGIHLLYSST